MYAQLIAWDYDLFRLFNTPWPGGDMAMWAVSGFLLWVPLYAFLLWRLWIKAQKRPTRMLAIVLGLALCVGGTDLLSARIMKPGFQRLRPSHRAELRDDIHLVTPPGAEAPYKGGRFGFVSSHAANHTGIAVFVGLLLGGGAWLWGLIAWALLIGYSRIYLGVHFPADVAVGSLVGALWGLALYAASRPIALRARAHQYWYGA